FCCFTIGGRRRPPLRLRQNKDRRVSSEGVVVQKPLGSTTAATLRSGGAFRSLAGWVNRDPADLVGTGQRRPSGRGDLLPAIRKIVPGAPVVGRRISINRRSGRRTADAVAFGAHALSINGVISRLQGATGDITVVRSDCTARD